MELLTSVAFSAVLLTCATALILWHVRVWRSVQRRDLEPSEREFRRRQYRRRVLTSILLGVLSLILPIGHWTMLRAGEAGRMSVWAKVGVGFIGVLLLLLAWMAVLALADIWATKSFFGRLRDKYQLEQTRLQAELRRIQRARTNGGANGHSKGQGPEVKGPDPEAKQE